MKILTTQPCRMIWLSIALLTLAVGCERGEQTVEVSGSGSAADQAAEAQRPLEHVVEFDGFTLRANVSRTDVLPDAMARRYGIEPEADLFLLNLVILEHRADGQPVPVSADVAVRHESLIGQVEPIAMREVQADGHVSYIGTLDGSAQRFFPIVIEAQPSGIDRPLQMDFEVQLEAFDMGDSE